MFRLGLCLVLSPLALLATDLTTILANMDRAEAQFQGMTARVRMVAYTALVDDEYVREGDMTARRRTARGASSAGVDLRIHFDTPMEKDLLVSGMKAEMYNPKIAIVEEYDLGDSRESVDKALLSGFGVAGTYLAATYDITMGGDEAIEGLQAMKLLMIPKDAELRGSTPKVEMWISTETWQPIQQKRYKSGDGDYELFRYTNVAINPAIKDSAFRLKLPSKVKRITPGR